MSQKDDYDETEGEDDDEEKEKGDDKI